MKPTTQIWGLWDCQELLSVHLTLGDARDALDEHLANCRCFTDDQDTIWAAVDIRAIRLPADLAPVEDRNLPTNAAQDWGALGRKRAMKLRAEGPSHADC